MKQLGRLLTVITWLLIAGGIIIISGGLLGRPLLMAAVPTTSMVPVLRPGDLIVVLPTWTVAHPGLGDIVVYKTPQDRNWIVHRIVDGNAAEGFITKGDANPIPDSHRVLLKDMAGVVPQVGGKALRMPRLGTLRMDSGPLSSPLVAGTALVIGVFLLVLDMQPRMPRLRHRQARRATAESILYMYVGLAATAFITTLIPAWSLSSQQLVTYEVIKERPVNAIPFGKYLMNEVHQETILIDNPSPLPLLVVFSTDEAGLTYEPWSALVPAHKKVTFTARIRSAALGHHEGTLRMGVFLPLLPPILLAAVAARSMVLAALVTALIPALMVVLLAGFDTRARVAIAQKRIQLFTRLRQS